VPDTLKAVAQGLCDDVKVTTVLNEEATVEGIEAAINGMKDSIRSSDVLVLFIAGHGTSVAGTYYFIPQDLQSKINAQPSFNGFDIVHDITLATIITLATAPTPRTAICNCRIYLSDVRIRESLSLVCPLDLRHAIESSQGSSPSITLPRCSESTLKGYRIP
jgi:hypothetical protein